MIRAGAAALLAMLVSGCTLLPRGAARPPDLPELRAVDCTLAAWHAAGYPLPGTLPDQLDRLAIVPRATDAQIAEFCQVPACLGADPPVPFFGCAFACTTYIDERWPFSHGTPVIVISAHVGDADRARGEPVIHEMLHILSWGLRGNPDVRHEDARLWSYLLDPAAIQTVARARYASP